MVCVGQHWDVGSKVSVQKMLDAMCYDSSFAALANFSLQRVVKCAAATFDCPVNRGRRIPVSHMVLSADTLSRCACA